MLTVTANNQTKVYGAANPPLTVSYSGFAGSDNAASLTTQPTATTTATAASAVGTYPITASGGVSSNYNFAYVAGTLTVTKSPISITISSDNNPACAGSDVAFSSTISASPAGFTGTLQFFDGATSLGTSPVSGDAGSLIISTLGVGSHSITVTYSGDGNYSSSTSAILVQNVKPRPTAVLSGTTTICNGATATLSLAVTGTGTITGTLSDGKAFSGTAPIITVGVSPSATTSYTIATLTNGTCPSIAADKTGTATVTVNQPVAITTHPASQTVCSNTTASFSVVASGTGTLTYKWYKGATLLNDGPRVSGATTSTITLSSLNAASNGSYSVVVSDAGVCAGVQSNSATLKVNQEINVTSQPVTTQTLCEGSNVTFTVIAQGTGPPFNVQWHNGATLINPSAKYTIISTTDITTTPATITTSLYNKVHCSGRCI